jgi:RNA polymerase sigma factor (sigma-70 family)
MQQRHSEGPGELVPSGIPSWEEMKQRAYRLLQSRFARDGQPADWEDMAQTVGCKVITALAKEEVDVARFDAWFYTVLRNAARDRHRSEAGRDGTRVFESWEDHWESWETLKHQAPLDVLALLTMLLPRERSVVILTYWYGFSSAEIARKLGAGSASTVRTWLKNALHTLRASAQEE